MGFFIMGQDSLWKAQHLGLSDVPGVWMWGGAGLGKNVFGRVISRPDAAAFNLRLFAFFQPF